MVDDAGRWSINGYGKYLDESCFEVVGPRIPTPDEPWQCVPVEPTHNMLEASGYDISIEAVEAWQAMLAAAPKPEDV